MKRYDMEKTSDSYYPFEIVEDKNGDFVKYDDIKHLLNYTKCQHEYECIVTTSFSGRRCKKCGHCI